MKINSTFIFRKIIRALTLLFSQILLYHEISAQSNLGKGYDFEGNGKIENGEILTLPLTKSSISDSDLEIDISGIKTILRGQLNMLAIKGIRSQGSKSNISITKNDLVEVIHSLMEIDQLNSKTLSNNFQLYQLSGEDNKGNVHFTGYFTPVFKVSSVPTAIFKYPIYSMPVGEDSRLTRKQIDSEGMLKGKDLEIAWSMDLLSNYLLQVQGSGVVVFEDGTLKTLVYSGQNRRAYVSLGKYLVEAGKVSKEEISLSAIKDWYREHPDELEDALNRNPSYVFFKLADDPPRGASSIKLVEQTSAAVDIKYIPYGSCLIAKVPKLDENGRFTHHEYQILLAHDRGGAIKNGHIDLYTGAGSKARDAADHLHHYGNVWLIMPKEN